MKGVGSLVADLDVEDTVAVPAKGHAVPAVFARQAKKALLKQTEAAVADPSDKADLDRTAVAALEIATSSREQQSDEHDAEVPAVPQPDSQDLAGTRQQPGAEEELGRSAGRPTRQRSKAQPYWMTGAAGSSPASDTSSPNGLTGKSPSGKPAARRAALSPASASGTRAAGAGSKHASAADNAAADSVAAADVATPGSGKAAGAKGKKPGPAKRQAKASPHKEGALQPAVKKSKGGAAKQQAEAVQSTGNLLDDGALLAATKQGNSAPEVNTLTACSDQCVMTNAQWWRQA